MTNEVVSAAADGVNASSSVVVHLGVEHLKRCAQFYHIAEDSESPLWTLVRGTPLDATELVVPTYIGNRALLALCDVIRVGFRRLKYLRMRAVHLYNADDKPGAVTGNTAIQAMCALLAGHPSLTEWDLSGNEIGVAAMRDIILLAKKTPSLTTVVLQNTLLTEADTWQLSAVLHMNTARLLQQAPSASTLVTSSSISSSTNAVSPRKPGSANASAAADERRVAELHRLLDASAAKGVYDPTDVTALLQPSSSVSLATSQRRRRYISYQRSKRDIYALSEHTMQCIRQRSALIAGDDVKSWFPRPLANLQHTASTDGKARALPFHILSAESWRKERAKSKEDLSRLRGIIRNTTVFQALCNSVFLAPPPPETKVVVPAALAGAPGASAASQLVAETDFQEILDHQRHQQDEVLEAIASFAFKSVYRDGEVVWEAGDTAQNVYLIDPLLSKDAAAVVFRSSNPSTGTAGATDEMLASSGGGVSGTTRRADGVRAEGQTDMSKTTTMPPGQFFGYDESLTAMVAPTSTDSSAEASSPRASPNGVSPLGPTRRAHCVVRNINGAARNNAALELSSGEISSDSSGRAASPTSAEPSLVHVWMLRREAFELLLCDPLQSQRLLSRRLVDAMPSLLGLDTTVRAVLGDLLSVPVVTQEKSLEGGRATVDTLAFPTTLLRDSIVVIEEGQLLVRRNAIEMSSMGRGDVVSLAPDALDIDDIQVSFLSGNMPAWRLHFLSIERLRASLPRELFHALVVRTAKRFDVPDASKEGSLSGWKRKSKMPQPKQPAAATGAF